MSAATRWYLQESNRGHTDFQSDALPTELRHPFHFCSAKVAKYYELQVTRTLLPVTFNLFYDPSSKLIIILHSYFINNYYLCTRFFKAFGM